MTLSDLSCAIAANIRSRWKLKSGVSLATEYRTLFLDSQSRSSSLADARGNMIGPPSARLELPSFAYELQWAVETYGIVNVKKVISKEKAYDHYLWMKFNGQGSHQMEILDRPVAAQTHVVDSVATYLREYCRPGLTCARRDPIGHRITNTHNIRCLGPSKIAEAPLVMASRVTFDPDCEKVVSDERRIEIVDGIEHDSRHEFREEQRENKRYC